MNCYLCQEYVALHAKYFEGAWALACRLCDFQDDDQEQYLDDQPQIFGYSWRFMFER
jgi:hypothetical protein